MSKTARRVRGSIFALSEVDLPHLDLVTRSERASLRLCNCDVARLANGEECQKLIQEAQSSFDTFSASLHTTSGTTSCSGKSRNRPPRRDLALQERARRVNVST